MHKIKAYISNLISTKTSIINRVYNIFEENIKEIIEVGILIDFIILDRNPLEINNGEIK